MCANQTEFAHCCACDSGFEKLLQDMRQARNETPYAVRQTKASQIQASGDVRDPSPAQQQQQQQPALGDQVKEDSSRPADQAQLNASPVAPGKEASTAPSEMNKQLEKCFRGHATESSVDQGAQIS